jgi:hypothetical protein
MGAACRSGADAMSACKSWRCFHCDEVFTDWGAARNHFGYTPDDGAPACRVEGGLASQLYHLRLALAAYRSEDTDLHRKQRAMEAEHAVALRRAEEQGYAAGLRDALLLKVGRSQL